jgi:hypothetical protein
MRTKWDILKEKEARLIKELEDLQKDFAWMERVKTDIVCSGCGKPLETEAGFAKHFVIPDERFLNLGNCPVKDYKGQCQCQDYHKGDDDHHEPYASCPRPAEKDGLCMTCWNGEV